VNHQREGLSNRERYDKPLFNRNIILSISLQQLSQNNIFLIEEYRWKCLRWGKSAFTANCSNLKLVFKRFNRLYWCLTLINKKSTLICRYLWTSPVKIFDHVKTTPITSTLTTSAKYLIYRYYVYALFPIPINVEIEKDQPLIIGCGESVSDPLIFQFISL